MLAVRGGAGKAENLHFLARQRIGLCGDGDESNSNFHQLLMLRLIKNTKIGAWLDRKKDRCTSAEIKNQLLKVMVLTVLRAIAKVIQTVSYLL